MVCPKCGRDCGSDAFCGGCGTKLEAAQTRKTGRLCPHCGGTEAIGNICAFCGLEIQQIVQPEEADSYEFPVGTYKMERDSLQLGADAISVTVNRGMFNSNTYRFPYREITAMCLFVPENAELWTIGYLTFRWKENKDTPLPKREECDKDKYTIRMSCRHTEILRLLGWYLRSVYPEICFSFDRPERNREGLAQYYDQVDKDAYFEKYCPYRDRAADALAAELAIGYREARNVIDKAFDERQEVLYAAQPELLLRDLNRVVEELRQKEEARKQRKEARREKRRSRRR